MLRLAFVFLLLLGTPLWAGKKPVTLEALGTSRTVETINPVWSPDGSRYVYESGDRIREFVLASRATHELISLGDLRAAAKKTGQRRAPFSWENRRVKESKIQWMPDGARLVVLAAGDLFLVDVSSGRWRQLTATEEPERDPKVSPDGEAIAFRRGNELFVLDIATGKERRLTFDSTPTRWNGRLDWVYPEELDLGTAFWWSPDSQQIAYLQFDVSRQMIYPHGDFLPAVPVFEPQRYPKAGTPNADVRLGVVPRSGGKTRWMSVGESEDTLLARVDWVPGGKSLLVQRLNRVQNRLDLLRADAETGKVKTLFTETDPFWINISDDLRVLRDGQRFLWSSERRGFRHLYLYRLDGQVQRELTSGDWEVEEVACVDERGGWVYYLSGETSPLERRLYRVSLDGSTKQLITPEPGWHRVQMSPGCTYFADAFSSLKEPERKTLRSVEGAEIAVLQAPDRRAAEEYALLPVEIVEVAGSRGEKLYARLIRPAKFKKGKKYPAVVMVYGGPHSQSVKNAWQGLSFEQVLAHRGFVVWQLDNRGSSGRGHAWESVLYRRLGKEELEDQKRGVTHLVKMGFVDPARIGIHGWSYGGFMTLYSLLNAPEVFRAGIAGAPVTDWKNYDTIYAERYLGLPSENEAGYRASSPVSYAERLQRPLLLIHNLEDDNVLFQNTVQMIDALERAGKQFELLVYPQKTHGVSGPARRHMQAAMLAFFERTLK